MQLVIDDREQHVIPYLDKYSEDFHIDCKIKRLQVGDYAICYRDYIMIIIERKTWVDLSASMRDGRKANIEKLKALRDSVGCQICYLIEGDACPPPTKMFSRLPAKNLRAHLDHIAFRDGIHMIYAKDNENSAYRLFELAQNYSTIKPSPFIEVDELIATQGGGKDDSDRNFDINKCNTDRTTTSSTDGRTTTSNSSINRNTDLNTTHGNIEKLTEKQESKINIQEQILRCIPGIGSVVSTVLSESGVTLLNIYDGTYTIDSMARLKFPTGASLGIDRATKIFNNVKMLKGSSQLAKKIQGKILETIPLVSAAAAKKILSVIEFTDIMEGNTSVEIIKDIQKTEKSKVGQKCAENILNSLLNKDINVYNSST